MSPAHDPFASTETYYADYRPGYGDSAVAYLATRFALDDASQVLDLGCGAGQITVPLAAHAGRVVGMDPNEKMLHEAKARATRTGRTNIEWVVGSDAELDSLDGRFALTTMGRSFHWMAQEETLERLHAMIEPGSGLAIVGDDEWFTRGTKDWQDAVYELAAEYLELPERTGPIEYDDPWDELVGEFCFSDVETVTFAFEREWTVEEIVGYVFSLSYCSPATFGTDRAAFESELRDLFDPDETVTQDAVTTVIAGRKPGY